MGWKQRDNGRIMAEINITPFTDVMLVLLVIFMVTAPLMLSESFKVKLPRAAASTSEPGKGAIIAISETGEISLDGRTLSIESLSEGLENEFSKGTERTVVVKADGGTRHSVLVKVLDTAKLAGAERLSIATEPEFRK